MSDANVAAERVLVVPGAALDRLGRFQGFCPEADRYLEALLEPGLATFRPRSEVEDDPSLKQIIPYVVFRCGDAVFCYTRGGSGGEARLRRRRSLGVGGHVAEDDADGRGTLDAYEMALRRELEEEVEVGSPGLLRRCGLINDDSTAVGSVHLGVVHVYELEHPAVRPRESALVEPGFVVLADLRTEWDLVANLHRRLPVPSRGVTSVGERQMANDRQKMVMQPSLACRYSRHCTGPRQREAIRRRRARIAAQPRPRIARVEGSGTGVYVYDTVTLAEAVVLIWP